MATEQELTEAIRRAGRAGDGNAVRALGAELNRVRQTQVQKPTSFWQGVGEEAVRVARRGEDFLNSINPISALANKALAMAGVDMGRRTQQVRAKTDAAYRASPYRGSTAGKVVGGVAATLPTMLLPGGAAVQGAASGALLSHSNKPLEVARDAVVGGVLGKAGDLATRGLASAVGGKTVSDNVRLLANEGITMTPGMRAGPGTVRNFIEDKVLGTVAPWVPNAATGRAEAQLRTAVANRVLAPIGESLPAGSPVNMQTIGPLQNKVYGALDDAAGNLSLQADEPLKQGLGDLVEASPRLMGQEGANQVAANADHIQKLAEEPISGDVLRGLLNELRSAASGAEGPLRDQLWGLHDNVAEALARQNGGEAVQAFNNARESATLMARLNDAASKSVNGEFGPTQLLQAAKRRGYGTTTANIASGDARLMDLANAAAAVMRNKTANSGTASRALAAGILGGGILGPLKINPVGGALVGSQLLGYVPGIADILQRAALNRPQILQQAGAGIKNAAPLVGYGSGAVGSQLVGP